MSRPRPAGPVMLSTPSDPDTQALAPALAGRLLACFQQALGHDLPNKLVALQGLARFLGEELDGRLDDDSRASLERLGALARQIDEQVRALAEVGRTCCRPGPATPVDLAELWVEVGVEVRVQSGGRVVRFDRSPELPSPVLPRESLRRVLREVSRDALRRCPPERPLHIRLSGQPGGLMLEVTADAPAPAQPERAFEPRADSPLGPSAGLGLFHARLLAESWGGGLDLLDPEGGGGFLLRLPANESARK